MLLYVIFLALVLSSVVTAVPTEFKSKEHILESSIERQFLLKRYTPDSRDSWLEDPFSLGNAVIGARSRASDIFLNAVTEVLRFIPSTSSPLNTHDSVGFVPEKTSFYGSLTGEQAAYYMSSRDRLPKTPPSTGCYDVYSYAKKPLCLHVKNGFTYVNCARITKYIRSNNNAIFLIDRMLDPTFNDYKQAKDGTCQR
ncbi:hypothetical protein BDF19DRAFT_126617 [Syncephalis fuscata]|nr:hypothetical protein BDF19DRAFT_126617 [Syncephalis fuscata]